MSKTVFLLVGNKKAGKSTFAQALFDVGSELHLKVEEIQLAHPLKKTCAEVFGMSYETFESQEFKETPFPTPITLTETHVRDILIKFDLSVCCHTDVIANHAGKVALKTPREILQYVGTQVLRSIEPTIHARLTAQAISESPADVVVVPDCRFPDELSTIRNVNEPIVVYIQSDKAEEAAKLENHETERNVGILSQSATFTVQNNGTKEAFMARSTSALKLILGHSGNAKSAPNPKVIVPALILWVAGVAVTISMFFTDTPTPVLAANVVLSTLNTLMNLELRTIPDTLKILKKSMGRIKLPKVTLGLGGLNRPERIGGQVVPERVRGESRPERRR